MSAIPSAPAVDPRLPTMLPAGALPLGDHPVPPVMKRCELSLPPTALAGLVHRLVRCELDPDAMAHFNLYRLPEGRCAVLFLRRRLSPAWTRLIVAGPRDRYVLDPFQDADALVGAFLEPGAASWIAGRSAHLLRNRLVDLHDLWGDGARMLHWLMASLDDVRALDALASALAARSRADWDPLCLDLVRLAARCAGAITVSQLACHSGYSQRHLRRLFEQQIGLRPKQLLRITRLHAVLAALPRGDRPDWSALAQFAGYADQSHLTAECAHFTGMTPARLITDRHHGLMLVHDGLLVPRCMDQPANGKEAEPPR